jgi:hypothetical protein
VLLDDEHQHLYMLATSPCCDGGSVYYKRSSLDNISFTEGLGKPFIKSATDANINDPTSTKQNLDDETGLLALASDNFTDHYLHNFIDLNTVGDS